MVKTGTVKFFLTDRGYGYIQPDDGSQDSFVHISAVEAAGFVSLEKNQRVQYEIHPGPVGRGSAINIVPEA